MYKVYRCIREGGSASFSSCLITGESRVSSVSWCHDHELNCYAYEIEVYDFSEDGDILHRWVEEAGEDHNEIMMYFFIVDVFKEFKDAQCCCLDLLAPADIEEDQERPDDEVIKVMHNVKVYPEQCCDP